MSADIHNKCATCQPSALCCNYVSFQIDGPTTFEEFDNLLWQVAHHGVEFFRDGGRWFISVTTRCRFLAAGNLCMIYERRPQICRDYSNDYCDRDGGPDFDVHLKTFEEMLTYMRKRFPKKTLAKYGTSNDWVPAKKA